MKVKNENNESRLKIFLFPNIVSEKINIKSKNSEDI